ncbi:MAG: sensor histidine kinase [Anaerolineae bacterium]|nr:sensor histidine kinase [Anaerolineae bacterium]
MNRHHLEPGLLSIFRLFLVLRLLLVLLTVVFYFAWSTTTFELWQLWAALPFFADIPFLFLFLSWPWGRRKLGRLYLPTALFVSMISPIVEMSYVFPLYDIDISLAFLLMFLLLLVPLILTAWQYPLRYVVLFSLGTSMLEFGLLSGTPGFGSIGSGWAIVALLGRSSLSIFVGYIVSRLVTKQRRQRRALAEANRKLVKYALTLEQLAISRERNRLARELHDTLAHALSGLAVQLEAILTVWNPDEPRARSMLERALSITRIGLDETRRALQALRATPLEDMGLILSIHSLAAGVAARNALALKLDLPESIPHLSPEVEQCYYRTAQEALENVSRHANADHVSVLLKQITDRLVLEISDDGLGFEGTEDASKDQFGIKGMQERADLIGGTLQVESSAGQGTTVRLYVEI